MRRTYRNQQFLNKMNYKKSILYIFLILTLSTYAACPDYCDGCDDTGSICFTCSGDYQVNVLGGCHANTIDKCIIYGPTDQCFRCQPTYTLVGGKCEKIYTGCVNEGNPNQCFECAFGLTLNGTSCSGVINCADFSGDKCNLCKEGYTLTGKICKDTSIGCAETRPADGICNKCKSGYFQSGYQCIDIKAKNNRCYIQDYNGKCPFCKSGYNGIQGKCFLNIELMDSFLSPTANFDSMPSQIVIENCQVLDNQNIGKCLICVQRYFPDDKNCKKVSNLCKDYNPQNGRCNSCAFSGFTLDNGKCVDINCVSRNNDDSCSTCKANFVFNNVEKICKLNDPNCKTLTVLSCQQCKVGFYITSQNICRALPANCSNADLNGKCITCIDRFFNFGSSCVPVSPNCNTYNTTTGRCTSCNTNLVLQSDGSCAIPIVSTVPSPVNIQQSQNQTQNQPQNRSQSQQSSSILRVSSSINTISVLRSDMNCVEYSGNACIRCSNRYYVGTDGRCVPVNPLCRQVNSVGQCTSCYPGYKIDAGRCIIAPSTDINCKIFVGQQCTQCYQGFYYHQKDKICKKLNPLCKTSNIVNGSCTSCYNGYNVNPANGNCQIFFRDPLCKQFKPDGGCKVCSTRHFLNTNGKCTAINVLCKQFNPLNGSCISCYPGHGLNKDNICTAGHSLDPNCINQQDGSCKQCISGFYLNEKKCKQANPFCKTFDRNNGNCLTCYSGYVVSNGTCIISQTQDPNCKKYEGQSCQGCYQGYILIRGQCLGLNPLCKTIDSATGSCTSCWTGYSLTADSNCAQQKILQSPNANDLYCIQVTNGVCSQCSSGYYYNREQGVCILFDPMCKTSDTNTGACTSCYMGYLLSNAQCVYAPTIQLTNCLTPGSNNQCLQCFEGYYLNKEKICTQVSILCVGYNKQTGNCTGCIAGHFLQDNVCIYPTIFDQNCIRYESSFCSRCKPGFYLILYVCQAIDPNCVNFNYNTSNCDTCSNNLFPNGPNCQ